LRDANIKRRGKGETEAADNHRDKNKTDAVFSSRMLKSNDLFHRELKLNDGVVDLVGNTGMMRIIQR
jgi:hypothetical protein